LTGFSIHPEFGFGLIEEPVKLEVFQQFFISLNLPYSIKRGETVEISATIFNYFERKLRPQITLSNDDGEFDFVDSLTGKGRDSQRILIKMTAKSGKNGCWWSLREQPNSSTKRFY
jgi:CD109 antigen